MSSKKITVATLILALFSISAIGSWAYVQAADSASSPSPSTLQAQPKGFRGGISGRMGLMDMGRGMGIHRGKQGLPWNTLVSAETQALFDELRSAQEVGNEDNILQIRDKLKTQFAAERKAHEAEMDAAIQGGYESWKTFVSEKGIPEDIFSTITEGNFDKFIQLHELRKKALILEEELGLNEMGMHHMKM